MSEDQGTGTVDTSQVEKQAREIGWVPKEDFKGDPDRWVDAESFVRHGEQVLPILRKTNEKLHNEMTTLRTTVSSQAAALQESREAIEEMKKFHTELTAERVKAAKAKLLQELAEARKEEQIDDEVRIIDEIQQLNIAEAEAKREDQRPVQKQEQQPPNGGMHPDFQTWVGENPWFGQDPEKTAFAQGAAAKIRLDPTTKDLVGRPFLDKVKERVDAVFDPSGRPGTRHEPVDRVEGSRGGGGGGGGGNGRTFADLPIAARDTVQRQAAKMVGDNKPFKTLPEWQAHYANVWFAGEV